jgi:hypothetical protein
MPTYQDIKPPTYELAPDGDYILRVVGFDIGLSKGPATSGCDLYEAEFEIEGGSLKNESEPKGGIPGIGARLFDRMIDDSHKGSQSKCAWRMMAFVKSCGVAPEPGKGFEFNETRATADSPWIDPIGLRCHAKVGTEIYQKKTDAPGKPTGKKNVVLVYYTDRPKLAPVRAEKPEGTEPF